MSSAPPRPVDALLASREPLMAGRFDAALVIVRAHLSLQPNDARGWALAARCLRELRRAGEAMEAVRRALQLQPQFPQVWFEAALLQRDAGNLPVAIESLQRCVATDPGNGAARWELARLLAQTDPIAALGVLAPLRAQQPGAFEPALLAAQLQARAGQHAQALRSFDALRLQRPDSVEALEGAYWAHVQTGAEGAARVALAQALVQRAPTGERWMNLAQERHRAGDYAGGRAAADAALRHDADFLPARWGHFQMPDAPAPQSDADAQRFRDEWEAGLAAFESIDFTQPSARAQAWACVGQCTAFFRHYLGDEVTQQRRYGQLVQHMMASIDGGDTRNSLRPAGSKRRIGFCAAYFREHTVARLFVPLIEALERDRFDIVVFSIDARDSAWSKRLRAVATCVEAPVDAATWRRLIAEAELDVLVYPEIGMHPLIQGLAALRLAPVQAVLWGHPVSTGMDSIDLFLSADALEPADAQSHYSERLVRLPGLGHGLRRADLPTPVPPDLGPRNDDSIDLLCAQTVFKLLPAQDVLFARILAALPNARLHLLADPRPSVCAWLRERMAPVLRAQGADPDRQLLIHGFLDHAQYLGLAQVCRLNLDTVGWSGGMSALDLLAQGLPTLCLPGASMRGRQTASLLRHLDIPELIASDADDYVQRAIALALDPAACTALSKQLKARSDRLFADPATAAAFSHLLASVDRAADGTLLLPD